MCCELMYTHSYMGIETNEYLNRQWYDHIDTMKSAQL
jgi:hypothetical protein